VRIGFRWLDDGESKDYVNLFEAELFRHGATKLPIEHDVYSPSGRHFARARCQMTVKRSAVTLDYSVFAAHNTGLEVLLGTTTFNCDKSAKLPFANVTWRAEKSEQIYECRIECIRKPNKLRGWHDDSEVFTSFLLNAQSLTQAELEQNLPGAGFKPPRVTVTTTSFLRNPYVVVYTLRRAGEHCERCNKKAPFLRKSSGEPYLEVHHRIPLSEGGSDDVENTIALCPNCHRESHFA